MKSQISNNAGQSGPLERHIMVKAIKSGGDGFPCGEASSGATSWFCPPQGVCSFKQ